MEYREQPPAPDLAPFVRCYWHLRGVGGTVERVWPDGRSEVVIHWGGPMQRIFDSGSVERQPSALWIGHDTCRGAEAM